MNARAVRLVLAIVLAAVAFAAGQFVAWRVEAEGELDLAASLLVAGDPSEAAARFAPYVASPLVGDRARAGAAFAHLLRGGSDESSLAAAARALDEGTFSGSRLVLWRLLRERHADSVLAVLQRAEAARWRYRVVETLARLELGELTLPAVDSTAMGLPRRFHEIVERRSRGDVGMLFDRHGRLIGSLTADGDIDLDEPAAAMGWDHWIDRVYEPPSAAAGVRFTLDLELSELVHESLGHDRGSIVVLDTVSGEVLAVATDARTLEREGPAFLDQFREPASISKLITTSAGLRAGVEVDREIHDHACRGSVQVEDGHVWCPVVAGRLRGLDQAMAWSCNTSFARLGLELGPSALREEYERFGFAAERAAGGAALVSQPSSRRWLAELSIGLEQAEITPLHAARMAAVFGNGGILPEARWTLTTDGYLGVTPVRTRLDPAGRRILDPATTERIVQAMRAVTLEGTARGVEPRGFPVAMKTGTASTPGKGYHVNYIGVGPWPDARYAFVVRITDQRSSRNVRWAARRVTTRLLSRLALWDGSAAALEQVAESPRQRAALFAGGG